MAHRKLAEIQADLQNISRQMSASDITIKLQGMVDDFYNNPILRRGLPEIGKAIAKYLNPADKNEFIQYLRGKGVNF